MKTAYVWLQGLKGLKKCLAYLDEGSAITLMTNDTARQIGCSGESTTLSVQAIDGISQQEEEKVSLQIGRPK